MNGKRYVFGTWMDAAAPLTAADAEAICREAALRREEIGRFPLDLVLRVLARVGRKWADPSYPPRVAMQEELPRLTGFSPEMVRLGLAEIEHLLEPQGLMQKVRTELGDVPRDVGFKYCEATRTALRWHPIGAVLHVLSGNVFLVGPGSLVEGLLTGNVTILKMSSAETRFMPAFLASLEEAEAELGLPPTVSRSIAAIEFPSSSRDVIATFKRHLDGIVVWGGEEAVRAYRNDLPARSRLVVFGPKLSVALVTAEGLAHWGEDECAGRIARELAVWDQAACTAPQVCFVEGRERAERLVRALKPALDAMQATIPAGTPDPDQAAEIRKLRTIREMAQIRGDGAYEASAERLAWTVFVDHALEIEPSPLHRTLRIVPFERLNDVVGKIQELRAYVQTVGLAASPGTHLALASKLGQAGVLRVMELGEMTGGEVTDPHDGAYDLPQLMNLVVTRKGLAGADHRLFDSLPGDERQALVDQKLRLALEAAAKLPFYADRLTASVLTAADLPKLPILARGDLYKLLAPNAAEGSVVADAGGYVTRSGGTTGAPAYSYFDHRDWNAMIDSAVEVFKACGLAKGDRLANCMMAGDLYGSFVSFNDVNQRLGVTSFAFAGAVTPESFLEIWRRFDLNAIQGMPNAIVPLLRQAKALEPSLRLEKVMYAGQPMNPNDATWLRAELGVARIASVIGTTEAGQLAYQSALCTGRIHQLVDDYNLIEIVDDEGRPVPDGTTGRILVTTLEKRGCPLIRYAIGDAGRILPDAERPAGAAAGSRFIEYLGRCDDIMAIGLMNIRVVDFERALEDLPISAMQLVGRHQDARDLLEVRVESDAPAGLAATIEARIFERVREVQDSVEAGNVTLVVQVAAPGALPRNPRTGKLRQLVDERFA